MKQSIMKYINSPISLIKITAPDKKLMYEPYLIVCQTNQYNNSKSKFFGYGNMNRLWAGIFNSNNDRKLTWKGRSENLSFSELSEELYDYDYSLVNMKNGKLGKKYFSLNLGMCAKLDDLGTDVVASMNRTLKLLAVDPNTFNEVRIDLDQKASFTVGPRFDGIVLLEYTVNDYSIENGLGCRVYTNSYSYKQCVTEALKVIF